jgi:hypothetical protein
MADDGTMDVMITKAKRTLAVITKDIPEDMFAEVFYRGLADVLNSGMSKILTKDLEGSDLEDAQNAAFEKASENLKALLAGEVKPKGARGKGKVSKIPAEVKTVALRLARDLVKDQIRADGGKPSHYKLSDITKWAKEILEADASLIEMAKAEVEARKATPVKISLSGLKPDEKLVAKAEATKAKRKAEKASSAAQAGIPTRRKAKPSSATAH